MLSWDRVSPVGALSGMSINNIVNLNLAGAQQGMKIE